MMIKLLMAMIVICSLTGCITTSTPSQYNACMQTNGPGYCYHYDFDRRNTFN